MRERTVLSSHKLTSSRLWGNSTSFTTTCFTRKTSCSNSKSSLTRRKKRKNETVDHTSACLNNREVVVGRRSRITRSVKSSKQAKTCHTEEVKRESSSFSWKLLRGLRKSVHSSHRSWRRVKGWVEAITYRVFCTQTLWEGFTRRMHWEAKDLTQGVWKESLPIQRPTL